MQKEVIDAIPVGRSHQSLAMLIPGLSTSTGINAQTQDVGGTNNLRLANAFTIHGGRTSDSNMQQDGFQVRNIGSFANLTNMFPDMGATQEMTIDYAAGLGRGGDRRRAGSTTCRGKAATRSSSRSSAPASIRRSRANNYSEDLQGTRADHAQLAQEGLRHQRLGRRPDREGQAVVLRVGAAAAERDATSPACTTT